MFSKKFTKTDYEILRVVTQSQTFNSKKIADEIDVSEKTVRCRLKIMQAENVFKKVAIINPHAFGYSLKVDFFLKIKRDKVEGITKWLLENYKYSLSYLGRHWGDDNISIQTLFKDAEEAEDFRKDLMNNDSIEDVSMAIVPRIFKDVYDWRPSQEHFKITEKGYEELKARREEEKKI